MLVNCYGLCPLAGVRALIFVGLERVANLDQVTQLEFGRGFMYNRPLRLNLLDLDYELAEQLVSTERYLTQAQENGGSSGLGQGWGRVPGAGVPGDCVRFSVRTALRPLYV